MTLACLFVIYLSLTESGQLTTPELNSLIGHAHRRVDLLQRQLVEQSAMEPLRLEAAVDNQRAKDERLTDENVAQERQHFATEITKLRDAWVSFMSREISHCTYYKVCDQCQHLSSVWIYYVAHHSSHHSA